MATAKKTAKKPRVKVINWAKESDKATARVEKKLNNLFKAFAAETAKKPYTTGQSNTLWRKNYKQKFEKLEKELAAVNNKVWLKYHKSLSTNEPKPGYKIV